MNKTCSKCKVEKDVSEFSKKDANRLQPYCKNCQKIKMAEWYKNNKEKHLKTVAVQKEKNKARVQKLKEKPCTDCKILYPYYVMDWDHIKEKTENVSTLIRSGLTKKALKEIEKCELVCSNCHRIRTYKRKYKGP